MNLGAVSEVDIECHLRKPIVVVDGKDERLPHDVSVWDLELERLVEYRVEGFAVHLCLLQRMG